MFSRSLRDSIKGVPHLLIFFTYLETSTHFEKQHARRAYTFEKYTTNTDKAPKNKKLLHKHWNI